MKNPLTKLRQLYKNLPIKHKMLLISYFQILIPVIIIGLASCMISEKIIQSKSIDYSLYIMRTIELRLSDCINSLTSMSQELLYDNNIYERLKDKDKNSASSLDKYKRNISTMDTLKKYTNTRNEIQGIYFESADRKVKFFKDSSSSKESIEKLVKFDEMIVKARQGHGKVRWYFTRNTSKAEQIFLVRTVYDRDNFKEIGLMVIRINRAFFESVYKGLANNDMKDVIVVSAENESIVSRNNDFPQNFTKNISKDIKKREGSFVDKGEEALITYVKMIDPAWKIISYIPLDILYKDIYSFRIIIICICLVTALLFTLLNRKVSNDFIIPIKRLVTGMKEIQKGTHVDVEVDRDDELGFITKTFNEMSKEISHLITWIYREQITRKEAQLKALQSQINPHFLFNTLESINWMAMLKNVPEISETVTALSSLMEASIGRDDKLIPLRDEFKYIDHYISILKKRFEDRIQLNVYVENNDILEINIPRLLIQPIIENAVYHGIGNINDVGVIRLNTFISYGILVIEVIDNGIGMDKESLKALNEILELDNDTYFRVRVNEERKSIGLENVNRRIKLFYGEKYGLSITSEKDEFTKVTVSIPVKGPIKD
ncbi:cache domain-containing sensor histidine kinase [Pseudobacteroides cellulosolvens]|uniref:Integral membrane sensor signal transduction histidine kinase n=1 Tax=Pseudobacteroides cellulosolvens ATCC 35603 = DSM 2933 TaxID=398512 RepID=A0A0L6JJ20_9FIRM|nr:sensor histidine kinase [Pseudobacteroides cellulosolvens]KNY25734.1 integral membrane sensor signal transduction histidine kinase [Pseudobacteroides cellulosolvens ATCC 35603 = DSM 2933]